MYSSSARETAWNAISSLCATEPVLVADLSRLEIHELGGDQMPEPYKSLLMHEQDMTHRLQAFVGQAIHIRPLHVQHEEDTLERRVLLIGDDDGRTVEFGAIRIHLGAFAAPAREEILACRSPLGAILKAHAIGYRCHPAAFFSLCGSDFLHDAFELDVATTLYGRVNRIEDTRGALLAEVVEVLPPLAPVDEE